MEALDRQIKKERDYRTRITVASSPDEAFNAINNIRGWWTGCFEGNSEKKDDVFTVRFGETFITVKITDMVKGQRTGWLVTDCYKHWLKDKKEWVGTTMTWEITPAKDSTTISFIHTGLIPGIECYEGCEKAWNFYINESLFQLLTTGKGRPG